MDFGENKAPVEVIKEGAFGRAYLRYIYFSVDKNLYTKSWKEFDQLKNIDQKFYCSYYYDVSVNVGYHYDFRNILGGLMKQILKDGFCCILDTSQVEEENMVKDKLIDGKELEIGLKANQLR